MATTNFEQWNSAALNQETDAEYLADTQRIGGVTTGSLAPSYTMNKFYYQASTFIAAFGQMLATKGYTNSDSSVATLAAVLANVVTESDLASNIVALSFSPTPSFNAASSNGFQMTLSGNITASTISGVTPGQLLAFYFVQDSVGGRTVSWPSSFVGALQPDTAAASVSVMLFRADLGDIARAVTPMVSNNGVFISALIATSVTLASGAPVNQVLTGNGTSFVAAAAPGFTSGSNAFGYWEKNPNGRITQWQNQVVLTGSPSPDVTVNFPVEFTNLASINVSLTSQINGSTPGGTLVISSSAPISMSGFMVHQQTNTSQIMNWIATGY